MKFYSVLKSREGRKIDFEKIEKKIEKICKKYKILLFYIYGSYAKRNPTKLSDIDLAYLPQFDLSYEKEIELKDELEDIFEDEAIDIVNLKKIPLTLIHRILKEGRCLYAKNLKIKIGFEIEKESRYFDTYWMRKEYFDKMLEKIENGTFWD
ncbi:MAG: nucleotidyltransferase domain-containing protein [Candidatus Omnitrophica bacterium]|nr:nucleotidyltransferase domain-containing protein [Candidatus Omnitrophota bacterium]